MALTTRITNLGWGLVMNVFFNALLPIRTLRRNLERFLGASTDDLKGAYGYLKVTTEKVGSMDMESISATAGPPRILLYFHGGGYFTGSIPSYRSWAFRMAHRFDSLVYLPEYRLAPEEPYPAALEDALRAYEWVRERHPNSPIFLGGDSAGGGLALALMLALRDAREALPRGAFLLCPYTDLTASGKSMRSNRFRDLWLSRRRVRIWAPKYYTSHNPRDAYISPVFGSYEGLPPLFILVGEPEVLLDDSRRVAEKARKADVAVELQIWAGVQHIWPIALPHLSETKEAMSAIASFLSRHTL